MTVQDHLRFIRLFHGSVLATSVVAVTQIVTRDELNLALAFATYCFAIAIPFLALMIACNELRILSEHPKEKAPWYIQISAGVGVFAGFAGIAALFWSFAITAGLIFTALSFLVAALFTVYSTPPGTFILKQ